MGFSPNKTLEQRFIKAFGGFSQLENPHKKGLGALMPSAVRVLTLYLQVCLITPSPITPLLQLSTWPVGFEQKFTGFGVLESSYEENNMAHWERSIDMFTSWKQCGTRSRIDKFC